MALEDAFEDIKQAYSAETSGKIGMIRGGNNKNLTGTKDRNVGEPPHMEPIAEVQQTEEQQQVLVDEIEDLLRNKN